MDDAEQGSINCDTECPVKLEVVDNPVQGSINCDTECPVELEVIDEAEQGSIDCDAGCRVSVELEAMDDADGSMNRDIESKILFVKLLENLIRRNIH